MKDSNNPTKSTNDRGGVFNVRFRANHYVDTRSVHLDLTLVTVVLVALQWMVFLNISPLGESQLGPKVLLAVLMCGLAQTVLVLLKRWSLTTASVVSALSSLLLLQINDLDGYYVTFGGVAIFVSLIWVVFQCVALLAQVAFLVRPDVARTEAEKYLESSRGVMSEFLSVVPIVLTAFVLSTFSSDVYGVLSNLSVARFFSISLLALVSAAILRVSSSRTELIDTSASRGATFYVWHRSATISLVLWVVLFLSSYFVSRLLIPSDVLMRWTSEWHSRPDFLCSDITCDAYIKWVRDLRPRLALSAVLASLGLLSTTAESLVPPRVRK